MTKEELEQIYNCIDGGFGETSGKLSPYIKELQANNERLERELKQTEVQDEVVIDATKTVKNIQSQRAMMQRCISGKM